MKTVELKELKDHLTDQLELVRGGEEILIVDRDRPIARLVRVEHSEDRDERMRKLVSAGIIVAPEVRADENMFIPSPAGDRPIPADVMDRLWEEEREGR